MMKRTMRKWFHFDGSDAKTAEAWLNRLGAEGWRLGRLSTWTACFWQTGERVRCAVTTRRRGDEAFRALCRDAGWELAGSRPQMEVYVSRPGQSPAPLETDAALESRGYLRSFLWRTLCGVLAAAVYLYAILTGTWVWPEGCLMWGERVATAMWATVLLNLLWDVRYLLRIRRTGAVEPRPMAAVWLWWWARLGVAALALAWLVLWLGAWLGWPGG